MNFKLKHFIIIFFSFLFFLTTLFIPVKLENTNQMENVKLGYPWSFVSQDFSKYNNGFESFPFYQRFEIKRIDEIKNFSIVNFFLSFFIVFLALELLIYVLEIADFRIRKILSKEKKEI